MVTENAFPSGVVIVRIRPAAGAGEYAPCASVRPDKVVPPVLLLVRRPSVISNRPLVRAVTERVPRLVRWIVRRYLGPAKDDAVTPDFDRSRYTGPAITHL